MVQERERPKEAELPSRRARTFFVRHGEPKKYGEDTPLTANGIEQVREFSDYLKGELTSDDRMKIVKILRSGRIRTNETAEIISNAVHNGISSGELGVVAAKENIRKRRFITPDNTLDPLISLGVSIEDAYDYWLSLSYEDAKAIGAKWSGDVAQEAFHLTHLLGGFVADAPIGPDLYYVLATHETTLGAILKHSTFGEQPIGFAQHVEIETRGEFMCVSFNEGMYSGKKKDFDWQIANARFNTG